MCGTFNDLATMETTFLSGDNLTFVNAPQYSRKGVLARVESTAKGVCVISLLLLCDPTLNETSVPIMEERVFNDCRAHVVIRSPDAVCYYHSLVVVTLFNHYNVCVFLYI